MPADLEFFNGKAAMAYAEETEKPWHGFGETVDPKAPPLQWLQAIGMDTEIRKAALWVNSATWGAKQIGSHFALLRMMDGKILDVVGSDYVVTQPREAFNFLKRFTDRGHMQMDTCGSLQGGQYLWGLAKIGASFTLKGGDVVEGYLLICSPYKYGESLQIKFVATRVVCKNTLSMALAEEGGSYRHLHFSNFDDRAVAKADTALGISLSMLDSLKQKAELLSNVKAQKKQVVEYVARLFDGHVFERVLEAEAADQKAKAAVAEAQARGDFGSLLDTVIEAQEYDMAYYRTQQKLQNLTPEQVQGEMNKAGKKVLDAILQSPGSDMESARGTWWGALNGVTYAVDHTIARDKDAGLTSAWLGKRAGLKEKALDMAVEYANGQQGSKDWAITI